MSEATNPILVRQFRGPRQETCHRAAFAITRGDDVLMSAGDIATPTFLRSGAKFFQAIPCVTSGAPERFHIGDRALALICASHNAEPEHVAVARRLLAAAGLGENDLICGPHAPMHPETAAHMLAEHLPPTRIHNNCSGKHAGMMLAAIARGESPQGYADPAHPIQREIRRVLQVFSGANDDEIEMAVDGCGAPTWLLPLAASARAFGRFGRPEALLDHEPELAAAALRLGDAIGRRPNMLAGQGRLCSAIAGVTGGRVLVKVGADGFYGAAVRDQGLGLALHVDDGSTFVSERLLLALLQRIGALSEGELGDLQPWSDPRRRNCAGVTIGAVEFDLP